MEQVLIITAVLITDVSLHQMNSLQTQLSDYFSSCLGKQEKDPQNLSAGLLDSLLLGTFGFFSLLGSGSLLDTRALFPSNSLEVSCYSPYKTS
jgi:hypothetical protein